MRGGGRARDEEVLSGLGCPRGGRGAPAPGAGWEAGGEIRSQFQAVPTERCYQDGTCRTEYFKALSRPPSGAGTGATALAGGGGQKGEALETGRAAGSGTGHPPRPSRVGTGG